MSNLINEIVQINIAVASTTTFQTNFNSLLIVGNTKNNEEDVKSYSSLTSLVEDGYDDETAEYLIAAEIFAQSPKLANIKIAQVLDEETFVTCYNRVSTNNEFYGVIITSEETADILAVSAVVETQKKIFGVSTSDANIKNNVGNNLLQQLKTLGRKRTFMFYHETAVAPAAILLAKMFTFVPGSANWIYKNLNGIAGENFTETQENNLTNNNCFFYSGIGSLGRTLKNGKSIGGDYLDVIYGLDYLVSLMQTSLINLLVSVDILSYNNAGIQLVYSAIDKVLKQAADRAFIDENYEIKVPNVADVSAEDKLNRILKSCEFNFAVTGAINTIQVQGKIV